jgi:hypothetical protein
MMEQRSAPFQLKLAQPGSDHPLYGIGGWLAWFMLVVAAQVVVAVVRFPGLVRDNLAALAVLRENPILAALLPLETFYPVFVIVGGTYLLVLTWKKDARVVNYWGVYLLACTAYAVFDIVACQVLLKSLARTMPAAEFEPAKEFILRGTAMNARLVVWSLVWLFYWRQSERVRVTFGSNLSKTHG